MSGWATRCARQIRAWVVPRLALTFLAVLMVVSVLRITELIGPPPRQKVVVDAPAATCPATGQPAVRCEVNQIRAKSGLLILRRSGTLQRAAQRYAQRMVRERFFAHVGPDGSTLTRRARAAGYTNRARSYRLGENIGWGQASAGTPSAIVRAWMASPPHREVILTRAFKDAGVGIATGTPTGAAGATFVLNVGRRARRVSPAVR